MAAQRLFLPSFTYTVARFAGPGIGYVRPMVSALLVDDVATFRKLVRVVLEDTGRFTIAGEAKDGVEAIELAGELQPDLVLLDLSMPRMDGLEALPRIKEASPDSKVVVFTGLDLRRVSQIAGKRGASACLEKSIPPDELVDSLLGLLDGHKSL